MPGWWSWGVCASQCFCCQCPCPRGGPRPPPASAGDPPTLADADRKKKINGDKVDTWKLIRSPAARQGLPVSSAWRLTRLQSRCPPDVAPGLEESTPRLMEMAGPSFLLATDRRHLRRLVSPQLLEAASLSRRQPTVPGHTVFPRTATASLSPPRFSRAVC